MINNKKLKQYWKFYEFVLEKPGCSKEQILEHLKSSNIGSLSIPTFDRLKRELKEMGLALVYKDGYSIDESKSHGFKEMAAFIDVANRTGIHATAPKELKQLLEYVHITEAAFKGNENINFLIECCRDKKEIHLTHFHFQDDAKREKIVYPYQVRENQGRWYLIGIEPKDKENGLKAFGIDRVLDPKATGKTFNRSSKYNPDSQYYDLIGLWAGKNEETGKIMKTEYVTLRTDTQTWNYFDSLKWHHSQVKIKEENGLVEFDIFVKPTQDLIRLILQWTPHVEVVSPRSLKIKVSKILKAGLELNS